MRWKNLREIGSVLLCVEYGLSSGLALDEMAKELECLPCLGHHAANCSDVDLYLRVC